MDRSLVWIAIAVVGVAYVVGELGSRWWSRRRDLATLRDNWGQPLRSDRSYRPEGLDSAKMDR